MYLIGYIHNVLDLKCDFLLYNKFKRKISIIIGNKCILIFDNIQPRLPFILYIKDARSKGNKNTYFNSVNTGSILVDLQHKWSLSLNDEM